MILGVPVIYPKMFHVKHCQSLAANRVNIISLVLSTFVLMACQPKFNRPTQLPPLKTALDCLPEHGALIAAHRATSRDWPLAENSISALRYLIDSNYLIAEIDIARLKDGTHILFHDGIWDEISTYKGPVVQSRRDDLDRILLKTRSGKLTADRPPILEDVLHLAKDKLYLEIDFKSSANISQVIDLINKNNMGGQVLLISYNKAQSDYLTKLAPKMLISTSSKKLSKTDSRRKLIWLGGELLSDHDYENYRRNQRHLIMRAARPFDEPKIKKIRRQASILVTDYAHQYLPITGLGSKGLREFEYCLAQ